MIRHLVAFFGAVVMLGGCATSSSNVVALPVVGGAQQAVAGSLHVVLDGALAAQANTVRVQIGGRVFEQPAAQPIVVGNLPLGPQLVRIDGFDANGVLVFGSEFAVNIEAPLTTATPRLHDTTERLTDGDANAFAVSVSFDGRLVMITSAASNLVFGDTNRALDVFVHNRETGETTRVTDGDLGSVALNSPPAADGRLIVFSSDATNLVAGDTNGVRDVFVHDRQSGQTIRVSTDSAGVEGNGATGDAAISPDGRFVAFESSATNLVANDTNNLADIFVKDLQTGVTTCIVAPNGAELNAAPGENAFLTFSADNRFLVLTSAASNPVPGDGNGVDDIFILDRETSAVSAVTQGNAKSQNGSLSSDGRFVAFESDASNLVANDVNNSRDVFVNDRQSGTTTVVSVDSQGVRANGFSEPGPITADGRFVVFQSLASNLVPDDTNARLDVFVHDRQSGRTVRLSVSDSQDQSNGNSFSRALSGDGRIIGFSSAGNNLVGGDTNGVVDAFAALNPLAR